MSRKNTEDFKYGAFPLYHQECMYIPKYAIEWNINATVYRFKAHLLLLASQFFMISWLKHIRPQTSISGYYEMLMYLYGWIPVVTLCTSVADIQIYNKYIQKCYRNTLLGNNIATARTSDSKQIACWFLLLSSCAFPKLKKEYVFSWLVGCYNYYILLLELAPYLYTLLFFFIIIWLYSVQHWRSDSNMCCSLWTILTY